MTLASLHKTVVKPSLKRVREALPLSKEDYNWEELQKIEERRRAILNYGGEPFWKVLFHWDGTVFEQISFDPLFWLTMALFVLVRVLARINIPTFVSDLASEDLAIVGGFLTFFLVFYVNQNHSSYFALYGSSMACKGRIFDVASLAVATLPNDRGTRLVRYMNAAHAACYAGLSNVYNCSSFFRHVDKDMGLLTEKELARMKQIDLDDGGSCTRELIAWCMIEIERAKQDGLLDQESVSELRSQVLQLRAKIGEIYNAADLPIPFFYVHFLCFLTALYLPLFAVSAAVKAGTGAHVYWTADVIAGLIVLLQSIFVIGLRVLGDKMSEPYGDDLTDLSVIHFVKFTWKMSNRILESHSPDLLSDHVENELKEKRRWSLGAAWEQGPGDVEQACGMPETMCTLQTTSFSTEDTEPDYDCRTEPDYDCESIE